MSFGCLINENLHEPKSDLQTKKYNKGDTPLPMTNPLGTQQESVIQVIIRSGTITESLSSMEYERDIETQLLLTLLEAEEWDEVVYQRFRGIFWTDEVKSYQRKRI